MIRIVFLGLALAAAAYLAIRILREIGEAEVDWQGVAFAAGFIVLAFYLRHVTEIGGLG